MRQVMVKQFVLNLYLERYPKKAKRIKGFKGYIMVIHSKPWKTTFDSPECLRACNAGISILSASNGNNVVVMKTWRFKKAGKPYGSEWVALYNNHGKKKHVKIEPLAEELFGEEWEKVKKEMSKNKAEIALQELF